MLWLFTFALLAQDPVNSTITVESSPATGTTFSVKLRSAEGSSHGAHPGR